MRVSGPTPRERARRSNAIARAARAEGGDVVVGAESVATFGGSADALARALEASPIPDADKAGPLVVPVLYDGPDLADVAARAGLAAAEVIALHAAPTYEVELLGFLPGFAYLGEVDERLRVPRRASPRPSVDAGAVALADRWTGIYPSRSPGGWSWIGRSLGAPWLDPCAEPPVRIEAGARVRFEPSEAPPRSFDVQAPVPPGAPTLLVTRAAGLALVQDLGRPGRVGQGLPPSGASDPRLLVRANRALENGDGAAAIELLGGALELQAARPTRLAVSRPGALDVLLLAPGERCRVEGLAIVAVEGGLLVPLRAGSRSTLLAAGLGGLGGRALRRGDALCVGDDRGEGSLLEPDASPVEALLFDEGPDAGRFPPDALGALVRGPWVVSPRSDRVGTRLLGAAIPRGDAEERGAPLPMCRGAIEVTTDGTPIVLGPDHPTTGGYPVLAVLRPPSAWDLARLRPGDPVRLRRA